MSGTEKIAEVLAVHRHQFIELGPNGTFRQSCTCGHFELRGGETGLVTGSSFDWIVTHQAEMVAAALEAVIREREKAAWDSCAETAGDLKSVNSIPFVKELLRINPYDGKEEA